MWKMVQKTYFSHGFQPKKNYHLVKNKK